MPAQCWSLVHLHHSKPDFNHEPYTLCPHSSDSTAPNPVRNPSRRRLGVSTFDTLAKDRLAKSGWACYPRMAIQRQRQRRSAWWAIRSIVQFPFVTDSYPHLFGPLPVSCGLSSQLDLVATFIYCHGIEDGMTGAIFHSSVFVRTEILGHVPVSRLSFSGRITSSYGWEVYKSLIKAQ